MTFYNASPCHFYTNVPNLKKVDHGNMWKSKTHKSTQIDYEQNLESEDLKNLWLNFPRNPMNSNRHLWHVSIALEH